MESVQATGGCGASRQCAPTSDQNIFAHPEFLDLAAMELINPAPVVHERKATQRRLAVRSLVAFWLPFHAQANMHIA